MFARLFQQRNDAVNLARGIFVGVLRRRRGVENRIDQDRDGLRDTVENQKLIGHEKIHHGRFQFIVQRPRHDGFDVVDEFIADETDRAAGEAWQPGQRDRAILFHDALDDFEAVLHALADDGGFHDLAVFDDLHAVAGLLDDRAGIAADERVAAQMFAALDGFKEEGFARAADFAIGRERRFDVREQPARDGNEVSLRGQLQKFFQCRRIHESFLAEARRKQKQEAASFFTRRKPIAIPIPNPAA